ncbi:MAG: lamin tail domain-containing protein [Planctomycetota bacterium]
MFSHRLRLAAFAAGAFALAGFRDAGADIVITEIHYAPADETGAPRPDLEFVELFNDGPEPYDLLGYGFTDGIVFTFEGRYVLDGRSYVAVCKDPNAVAARYGIANVVGPFQGALENDGERVAFANAQGAVVSAVRYNDRGKWPSGARGTGHSLSLRYEYSDPSEPENWTLSAQMGGTPGKANFAGEVTFEDKNLISVGEIWRYFKGTEEPSSPVTAWRQVSFDDSSWLQGPTGIGYGDGDDATVLDDMQGNYRTVFCRKKFTLANPAEIDRLVLSIGYDDGFAAYLNGTQVAARNVSGTAYNDFATGTVQDCDFEDIDISSYKSALVAGTNVLAIQVHNVSDTSSDLSLIPALVSRRVLEPGATATVPVAINEALLLTSGERFVELYNASAASVDVSGFYLTDDFADLTKYRIPEGTQIPGRGFLALGESELGLDLSVLPGTKDRVSLALSNALATRVVDAYIFEPKVPEKSEARIPDGTLGFSPAADPTPNAPNRTSVTRDVVLNEIMYHPISLSDDDEYIELYNRGTAAVDLSGWKIEGVGDFTFPPGTAIAPDSYLVCGRNPARLRARYGDLGGAIVGVGWTGALRDSGERIRLLDPNGVEADSVRYYDGGEWSQWADAGGSSLELIDPRSDNSVGASWDASDDSEKSVPATLGYGPVTWGGRESDLGMMLAQEGIAIVDDIALVRSGTSTNLVSNGHFDTTTSPWRIEGTHIRSGRTTDPAEVISGTGSLKLIAWNGSGDYKVNRIETDTATQTSGVTYEIWYTARWIVGSNRIITIGDYSTAQPQNPGLAGSIELPVPDRLGTPGAQNSVTLRQIAKTGSANVGPAISEVSHSPGVPEGNETVTVRARISDPDGVASAAVFYRTESAAGAFTQRPFSDPDGDGIYEGTIPAQALGTRVLFYVAATDGRGQSARYPKDISETTHPPVLRPASPSPTEQSYLLYRHDTRVVSTRYHSLRFVLSQEGENELRTRRSLSNQLLDGTLVFGSGDVYYNAGIRFAGSPWLRGGPNDFAKSYVIKTPRERPLHGRKYAFNLDEHATDGRERLSQYLLRLNAGGTLLPHFDFHSLVRFQLNAVHTATKELLDKPNADYMEFWFPGTYLGPFFEMDDRFQFNDTGDGHQGNAEGNVLFPPYGATTGGPNKENYRWFFSPRGGRNKTLDDFEPLIEMCSVIDDRVTNNANFDRLAGTIIDVEEFLRVWAIRMNTDDWDTWGGNRGKNCYFYRYPADGIWRLVPWDLELTYGNAGAFSMPSSISQTYSNHFREITRMINRPRVKRLYYGILAEMVDAQKGFFFSQFLSPYTSRLSSAGVGSLGAASSGGFIDQRAASIRSWIRASIFPQQRLVITTNGGEDFFSETPRIDLTGDAPTNAFYVLLVRNGEFVEDVLSAFSDSSYTRWTMSGVPLVGGANALEVVGLDSKGNYIDGDTIRVTYGVEWDPPAVADIEPSSAAAGDSIAILGTGFHDGLKVFFGSIRATEVTFRESEDPGRIAAVVPQIAPGEASVTVENLDRKTSAPFAFTVLPPAPKFVRGDANLDGLVDVSDPMKILFSLFRGDVRLCADSQDANDDGDLDITDAVYALGFLFQGGPPPPPPFPQPGADPTTEDYLDCDSGLSGA